jgi:hypothetical protein
MSSYLEGSNNRRIAPKKKKRKYSVDNTPNGSNPSASLSKRPNNNLSINIIDRVLDLSRYKSDTTLYALSRDWINATTETSAEHSAADTSRLDTEPSMQKNDTFVYQLPDPIKEEKGSKEYMLTRLNGNLKMIRDSEENDLELIKSLNVNEDDSVTQTHALLRIHVNRWKNMRKEWTGFYQQSYEPYKNTTHLLRSIYEDS